MVAHAHCGGTKQNDATNNGVTTQHGQCGGGQTRNNCLLLLIACTLYCHVLLDHSCKHHRFFISDYNSGCSSVRACSFPCKTTLLCHLFAAAYICQMQAVCVEGHVPQNCSAAPHYFTSVLSSLFCFPCYHTIHSGANGHQLQPS